MQGTPFRRVRISRKELHALFDRFLKSLRQNRPETRGTYDRALREFFRWFSDDGHVTFLVEDIERYKRHLTQRKKLSPVSVSTYLTAVRRFCEYLVHAGVLVANPARPVNGNERPRTHSRESLTSEEVDRLLVAVDRADERGRRDFAVILLMLECALSEIEIIRADVGDLVIRNGEAVLAVQGKGRLTKDALVSLPPEVREAIRQYLSTRESTHPSDPLFASAGNRTRGERMTTRGVRDRVNACLERAGIKQGKLRRLTPYSLRHTAAARMARRGATAEEIQKRMRLGSLTTAMLYLQKPKSDT
jgi:site-specific recombinase XerD